MKKLLIFLLLLILPYPLSNWLFKKYKYLFKKVGYDLEGCKYIYYKY